MRLVKHQTRRRRLLSFGVGLALAITTAIVLAASVGASAADTESLTLEPGDNDVGWVGEPIAVTDIFEQIPQASLIYTWNAISRSFVSATADDGGNLETIEPGMAVTIRVDGQTWPAPLDGSVDDVATLRNIKRSGQWNRRAIEPSLDASAYRHFPCPRKHAL